MTPESLAAVIDHTILKPEADPDSTSKAVEEGVEYGFASVCVQPAWVKRCVDQAAGRVALCSVVGFPHGANRPTVKAIEATMVIKDGAGEVDLVAFLPHLLARDVPAAKAEVAEVVRAARAVRPGVVVKVIVESALLTTGRSDDEAEATIADACRAVREGGADFIKTSTGFHPVGGAEEKTVRWMAQHAGGLQVKASGGIRTLTDVSTLLHAGADRIGMSAGVAVVKELAAGATR